MIRMRLYGEDYEQDARPLIKSFYPDDEIQVMKTEETSYQEAEMDESAFFRIPNEEMEKEEQEERKEFRKHHPHQVEAEKEALTAIVVFHLKKDSFLIGLAEVESKESGLKEYDFKKDFETLTLAKDETEEKVKRRIYRNELHRKLYEVLSQVTKKTLPWGTLTGIRPTKQVLERLEVHQSEDEIRRYLKEEYYTSDEKIDVSLTVAKREKEILDELDYKDGYSIYIGIPFCPSTCNYCSFTSFPLGRFEHMVEPYLEALEKEIEYAATAIPNKKLSTIYFGGGTPTTLSAPQLERVLKSVHRHFDFSNMKELTVEAGRPDSITMDKLVVLKEQGVDRISINPQTMRQKTLDLIGRKHTVEQIEEAFYMAREAGHTNINMDLILGLSGENKEDVAYTLDRIHPLNPDSLTVHTLAIKRAARLNTNKEEFKAYKAQDVQGMMELTKQYTKANDYHPYYLYRQKNMAENLENVGYARIGKEGIYNILIMEEKQTILALGAGASSKFVFHDENRIERVENVKSLKDYIERTDEMIARKMEFLRQYGHGL